MPDVDPHPKVSVLPRIRSKLKHLLAPKPQDTIKEAIEEVLEEHEEEASALPPQEKAMLRNVLSFGDLTVADIMIPRTDIVAVPIDIELIALKKHLVEQRHTRTPVYQDKLDCIKGFLHIKDILAAVSTETGFDLKAVMRPMLFVPPSMKIIDLLVKMRRARSHMAIVVDEFGGTDGLVTLEDLIEEIVGEIRDEHDDDEYIRNFIRLSDHTLEADARIRIEVLEQELGMPLLNEQEKEEFDTLGGLIFFQLGRVPVKGERVQHKSGVIFEIVDADARRAKKVRIIAGRRKKTR